MIDNNKIHEALQRLDVKEDNHWTNDGLPRIDVVAGLSGIKGLKRGDITAAAPAFTRTNTTLTAEPLKKDEDTMLLGSSVQPANFELTDGSVVQLGTVVAEAHKLSGLTTTEFNDLSDDMREKLIADVVAGLDLKTEAAEADPDADKHEDEDGAAAAEEDTTDFDEATLQLDAAKAALAKATEATEAAKRVETEAQAKVDALIEAKAKTDSPHQNQQDIMQFIESQKRLREQRAGHFVQVSASVKSPLDQSMARKTGFGGKRPDFNPRAE